MQKDKQQDSKKLAGSRRNYDGPVVRGLDGSVEDTVDLTSIHGTNDVIVLDTPDVRKDVQKERAGVTGNKRRGSSRCGSARIVRALAQQSWTAGQTVEQDVHKS